MVIADGRGRHESYNMGEQTEYEELGAEGKGVGDEAGEYSTPRGHSLQTSEATTIQHLHDLTHNGL